MSSLSVHTVCMHLVQPVHMYITCTVHNYVYHMYTTGLEWCPTIGHDMTCPDMHKF